MAQHARGNSPVQWDAQHILRDQLKCYQTVKALLKLVYQDHLTVMQNGQGLTTNQVQQIRYNKSGGNRFAAASLRYGCANYCYNQSISSPEKIASSSTVGVHTPMTAYSGTPTRSCGRVSMTGPIPTPIPVSDAECTGAN